MNEAGCEFRRAPKWSCLFLTPLFKGYAMSTNTVRKG